MSPPTKNTYWIGVITTFCLVSTSYYFASSSFKLSFLSPHVALGNFSDYSPLVLICISVSFSRVLLRFCFFCDSLFLLSFHFFFLDIRSIFGGIWFGQQWLSCLLFLLIFLKASYLPALFQRQLLALDQHSCNIFAHNYWSRKSRKRKERKPLPSRVNPPQK